MTKRFAIAATAALFMVQLGTAEATLSPSPESSSAFTVSSTANLAAPAELGALSGITNSGLASTAADQAQSDEKLAFGVRIPGLKTVGRAMGALTPGGSSGNTQVEERRSGPEVRDHRSRGRSTAPRVRDHRVAPRVRDHRATANVRERTRVESRRGQQAQTPQLREQLGQ